jgi:CheY-like chemotaxis protein/HPt (histidine-containing phosphotransfer) domain-containing protein
MSEDAHDQPGGGARRVLRVLLVEDDGANQEVESLMLEHLGHDVDVVADGAAAVTAAAAERYDAIVMDCHLPGLDGYGAAAAIRLEEGPDARVPIIGVTAHDDRRRCIEAGMDDRLGKPFALTDLAEALERAVPPAAGAFAGVLDPAIVDQLRALARAGSPDLLERLHASFARDTPPRLSALRAAVASGDRAAMAFNVHTLKGSAANLGAEQIAEVCRELEVAIGDPDPERLEPLLRALEGHAADAQAALARLAEAG